MKSGEKIAFLGDSITRNGWNRNTGYVRLVIAGLAANGVVARPVPAGVGGDTSTQMLARLDKDVLARHPQWMTVSCGINDVWHGAKGVPLDAAAPSDAANPLNAGTAAEATFKSNVMAIVDKASAAGVKVVLLTSTVISEKLGGPENVKLGPYNEFLREVAKEKALPLADLNTMFHERIAAANSLETDVLTSDGVHLNADGDRLVALGLLKVFGLNADELEKAQASWVGIEEK